MKPVGKCGDFKPGPNIDRHKPFLVNINLRNKTG